MGPRLWRSGMVELTPCQVAGSGHVLERGIDGVKAKGAIDDVNARLSSKARRMSGLGSAAAPR